MADGNRITVDTRIRTITLTNGTTINGDFTIERLDGPGREDAPWFVVGVASIAGSYPEWAFPDGTKIMVPVENVLVLRPMVGEA
jgi:hypothetical protein